MKATIKDITVGNTILAKDVLKQDSSLYEVIEIYKCLDSASDNKNKTMFLVKKIKDKRFNPEIISEDEITGVFVDILSTEKETA